ncbi:MAG: extracellular solute-binding protein [Pseudomonadota bacterium]
MPSPLKLSTLLCVALAIAACGKKENEPVVAQPAAAQEVYFCNWSEYIDPTVLDEFTKQTGIKVNYATYDSNETLYAKMKLTDGGGCDIVVPSTYFISKLAKEGMLAPIDRSKLPNFGNLDPTLLNQPYDPNNAVSVPYMWGLSAIAVNTDKIDPKKISAWSDLWKPEFKGQVLLLDDVRETFAVVLRSLGYSGNTTDPKQIEAAYHKLVKLMPNVRKFDSESPKDAYLQGDVSIGMLWNGEAFLAQQENPKIALIYPKEGSILWIDNLAIPAGTKRIDNAHALINFLLDPAIARRNSETVGYGTPNLAALKLLDPAVAGNPVAYPGPDVLKKAEMQVDIGDAITVYEDFWQKLKAGQ